MSNTELLAGKAPLVSIIPSFEDSYGFAAIKLARAAELILDEWQEDSVNSLMGVRPNGMWCCREFCEFVPRQNGKGAILEARVLAGLFLLGEKLIVWTAHEVKTSDEAFIRVSDLIHKLEENGTIDPGEIKILSGNGTKEMRFLKTGQRLRFIARSKSAGRGFTGDLIIVDEAFAFTLAQQEALRPTIRARPHAQIIYTSTPPLDGVSGEVMYSLRERALGGTSARLGYRDWTALDPKITLDDINKRGDDGAFLIDLYSPELLARSNPALGIRIDADLDIKDEVKALGKVGYAREYLGIWPKRIIDGGGAIDPDEWKAVLKPDSVRTGLCGLSVDVAPRRDAAAIGLYGDGENGLGHMQLVSYRLGTNWIIDKMIELRDVVNPICWSMSKSTYAFLERALADNGFKVPESEDEFAHGDILIMDVTDSAAACGQMIVAVRDQTMSVRPDPAQPEVLNNAVYGAQFREGIDAVSWSRKGNTDVTPLVGVTNARFGFVKMKDNLVAEEAFFGSWR